ncbi:AFG1/ZapE family ATPase [Arthrobacter sp. ISL-72]|uniref:AFG1/ZapE family ATPase n=1 Tax=Arthrobacter sp. ISL-72 TaxID=2819114 RepID=UPI001BEBB4D9|nr:AFG1/ZapE family ATPase [Arthrobacter sp. ISL-72]MBT2594359.1 cell division protein ZapE [Arthrobacter sp. ISL-72]
MADPLTGSHPRTFRPGRIIVPGTSRQLGAFGLFTPAPGQRRTVEVAGRPLSVKSAEGDLLWISFGELTAGNPAARDFDALAARFGEWVVDGVPGASDAAVSPEWRLFLDVVDLLFDRNVTLFVIGAVLPDVRADSPLALLLRVESDEELPDEQSSGC